MNILGNWLLLVGVIIYFLFCGFSSVICGIIGLNQVYTYSQRNSDFYIWEVEINGFSIWNSLGFLLLGVIFLCIGSYIILRMVRSKKNKARALDAERRKKEQEGQYIIEMIDKLQLLLKSYSEILAHKVEETKTAWLECNNILRTLVTSKYDDNVFHVYSEVGHFLSYKMSKDGELSNEILLKLWDFYYQVAYTYDLDFHDQEKLLSYLLGCFRGSYENNYRSCGDYSAGKYCEISLPYTRSEWEAKLLDLLEEGCRRGSALGARFLAHCYYAREVVELRDYDKAFALYQQAAQLGDIQSVYMMGRCYEKGNGTKKNPQKAGDCYQYAYDCSKDAKYADALDKLYTAQRWDKNRYSPDIFTNNMAVMKKDDLETIREKLSKYAQTDLDTAELRVLAVSVGMLQEDVVNSFIACYESASIKDGQSDKINLLLNKGHFTDEIANKAHTIRKLRNRGAHDDDRAEPIKVEEVRTVISYMKEIVEYYATY